jgi:hypothetical protein
MSKAVLISIRPKWCEKIINGDKTIEVRKTRPKMNTPFKCYIYCTQGGVALGAWGKHGKIIGEFTCDRIYELETKARGGSYYVKNEDQPTTNFIARQSCLDLKDMHGYLHAQKGYGWHITDLRIYDAPRELSEFRRACPNSWYCESCAMYWENNGACGNESLQFKRAPQSWCYVEEARDE